MTVAAREDKLAEPGQQTSTICPGRSKILNLVTRNCSTPTPQELRTPLTIIEGYIGAILDGLIEVILEIHATILAENGRLKHLANDANI